MVVSGNLSSISVSFCIPTSHRQWVDSQSIWGRFGVLGRSWEGLGRVLGSFGVPLGAQDRILIDFRSISGPLLGPSRPQLGSLRASLGVLRRSLGGLEPVHFRSYFQVFFGLHFPSISDPRTSPKSFRNQLRIRVKIKLRKKLVSLPLPSKFQENVMLKPKTSIYEK